ncbi:MAG: hypothetical protein K0S01_3314 [Herbinix sp.]|jgi:hypothetical protein|nr:hypothetical protein [Herbinix sp.]
MEKRRIPKPGEIYNHFKDKPYQIITVAIHSETREPMVVYQALYGDFKTYVRPLEMFTSEVDHIKYPEIKQMYRFELRTSQDKVLEEQLNREVNININQVEDKVDPSIGKPTKVETVPIIEQSTSVFAERMVRNEEVIVNAPEGAVNAILLKFLDAESYSRKLDVITSNIKHLNDRLINDMAVSLDCAVNEGPLDQRIHELIYCLQAMCRFEDKRLR